jgi:hypothetical protein
VRTLTPFCPRHGSGWMTTAADSQGRVYRCGYCGYEAARCDNCQGRGLIGPGTVRRCKSCNGTGWRPNRQLQEGVSSKAPQIAHGIPRRRGRIEPWED